MGRMSIKFDLYFFWSIIRLFGSLGNSVLSKMIVFVFMVALVLPNGFVYSLSSSTRVIGGENTALGEFPFVVSIRLKGIHVCGGSLITHQHVLTAAHCYNKNNRSDYEVFLSSNKLLDAKRVEVKNIKIHENYIGQIDWWKHDLAVLKLNTPIKTNEYTQPIEIRKQPLIGNETLTALGWGLSMEPSYSFPNTLQKLTTIHIDETECRKSWQNIHKTHLCFWTRQDDLGICKGDSGGPLIYNNELVGILSWTPYFCATGKPDVAVRLSPYFLSWICLHTK